MSQGHSIAASALGWAVFFYLSRSCRLVIVIDPLPVLKPVGRLLEWGTVGKTQKLSYSFA